VESLAARQDNFTPVSVHVPVAYMYLLTCMASSRLPSMPRSPSSKGKKLQTGVVREPVQVYLGGDDSALLNRLAEESGLSKAEILRRGVRSYAREHGAEGVSPMLRFLSTSVEGWPRDVAADHDQHLAAAYKPSRKKRQ